MLSVTLLLLLAAFVCTVASALDRCPLWIAVILLVLAGLLGVLPR
jgi:hypothetical protein